MSDRVQILLEGRVQGVGYRYATYQKAKELGVKGYVKNLPDGRVEAVFEGPNDKLKSILAWCERGGPRFARVDNVEVNWLEGKSHYRDFSVVD